MAKDENRKQPSAKEEGGRKQPAPMGAMSKRDDGDADMSKRGGGGAAAATTDPMGAPRNQPKPQKGQ